MITMSAMSDVVEGPESDDDDNKKVAIPRHLSLLDCVWHTVGTVIGTGIFVSPTGVLRGSGGSVGVSLLIWVACGIIQTCGVFIYTEMALMFRKSGGEVMFLLEGWGPAIAFLKLWSHVFVIVASPAVQCLVIARYLLTPVFGCTTPPATAIRLIGAAFLLGITTIHCLSVKIPTKIAWICTITKTFGLVVIIVTGMYNLSQGHTAFLQNAFSTGDPQVTLLPVAFYSGMFAYGGWDTVVSFTEEVKRPERNIPVATVISMVIITTLYLLANVSYLTLLSPEQIIGSEAVAADYSVVALGSKWSWLIWFFVATSAFGNLNGGVLRRGRQTFAVAREGLFPEIMAMLNITYYTPIPAILTVLIGLVYLLEDSVIALIQYLVFVETVFDTMTVAVLPYFRWKYPNRVRPFRAPIIMTIIYIAGQLFIMGMAFYLDPLRKSIGLLVTLTGLVFYFAFINPRSRLTRVKPYSDKMTRGLQRLFYCIHQEKKTF